jgi:sec-independent protein translocase protein TatA
MNVNSVANDLGVTRKHNQQIQSMQLNPMLAMLGLGGGEIILILSGVLLLFGGKKLPELAKGLGNGIREFKKATSNASEEMRHVIEDAPPAGLRRLPPAPDDAQRTISQVSPEPKALPAPTPQIEAAAVLANVRNQMPTT